MTAAAPPPDWLKHTIPNVSPFITTSLPSPNIISYKAPAENSENPGIDESKIKIPPAYLGIIPLWISRNGGCAHFYRQLDRVNVKSGLPIGRPVKEEIFCRILNAGWKNYWIIRITVHDGIAYPNDYSDRYKYRCVEILKNSMYGLDAEEYWGSQKAQWGDAIDLRCGYRHKKIYPLLFHQKLVDDKWMTKEEFFSMTYHAENPTVIPARSIAKAGIATKWQEKIDVLPEQKILYPAPRSSENPRIATMWQEKIDALIDHKTPHTATSSSSTSTPKASLQPATPGASGNKVEKKVKLTRGQFRAKKLRAKKEASKEARKVHRMQEITAARKKAKAEGRSYQDDTRTHTSSYWYKYFLGNDEFSRQRFVNAQINPLDPRYMLYSVHDEPLKLEHQDHQSVSGTAAPFSWSLPIRSTGASDNNSNLASAWNMGPLAIRPAGGLAEAEDMEEDEELDENMDVDMDD